MKSCEYYEEQLSAFLDGESARQDQMELLDHLVLCESCRRFHAESRALDALVAAPSAEIWQRIQSAAERPAEAIVRLGEESGRMTDDRFVELTQEILRADPRYRTAMYHVMEQVMRDTADLEAAIDYDEPGEGPAEGGRADGSSRLPV